jgi:type I restriction enzyme S subunit
MRQAWKSVRLRFVADINPLPPQRENLPDETEVSFLAMESIGEDGRLRLDAVRPAGEVRSAYSFFQEGDVAFAKVTPCFENGKGALMSGLVGGIGFGTTELTVLRPRPGLDPRFLHYFVTSPSFRGPAASAMTGAGGLKRVPEEFTRNTVVLLPPQTTQSAIAAYLDGETARIDALIEKKTRFIGLLREKRQALVSRVVTQGLEPNRSMKDSGVTLIGQIPDTWAVSKIKRLISSIGQGWSPECESRPAEPEEWAVLKVGCVNGGVFRPQENKALPESLQARPELSLRMGDILVSRANTRDLVGSCAVVDKDYPRLMLCDKLYRLRAVSRVAPEYLAHLIAVLGRRLRCPSNFVFQRAVPMPPWIAEQHAC